MANPALFALPHHSFLPPFCGCVRQEKKPWRLPRKKRESEGRKNGLFWTLKWAFSLFCTAPPALTKNCDKTQKRLKFLEHLNILFCIACFFIHRRGTLTRFSQILHCIFFSSESRETEVGRNGRRGKGGNNSCRMVLGLLLRRSDSWKGGPSSSRV